MTGSETRELRAARIAVTLMFLYNGTLFGSWVARIPAVQRDIGLSEAELGLALFGIAAGALVAMPAAGWWTARAGSAPATRLSMLAFAGALLLPALSGSLPALAGSLFLLGLGSGGMDVAMNVQGVAVEQRYDRPILSSLHAAFSFGGLIGAAGGGVMAALGVDPLAHFAGVAAVVAVTGLVAARFLLPGGAHADEAPVFVRPPRRLALLGIAAFCCLFAEGAAADWSAVYLTGPLESSAGVAATAFAAFSLAMAIGRLLGDRLAARFGPVRLVRAGGALAAAGLAFALVGERVEFAVIGFGAMGAGLSTIVPTLFRAADGVSTMATGVAIAAVSTVGYLGFLVGPPLIGVLAELLGLGAALGVVVALCAAIAGLAGAARPRPLAGPARAIEPALERPA